MEKSLQRKPKVDTVPGEEDEVAIANKRFYDQIADGYDQVDTRRKGTVDHSWVEPILDKILSLLAERDGGTKDPAFLDAGSGSGFLALRAHRRFKNMAMVDISQKMLDRIDLPGTEKICSDVCSIPVEDASYDVVGAFATLHHLRSPEIFFKEAFRILRPGGVLYSDHDIESKFVRQFRPLLQIYRALFDHGKGYLKCCPDASKEDYLLSEYHGDKGLSGPELEAQLRSIGFNIIEVLYHWEGMGPLASVLEKFGMTSKRRGLGPVVRILAVKP